MVLSEPLSRPRHTLVARARGDDYSAGVYCVKARGGPFLQRRRLPGVG